MFVELIISLWAKKNEKGITSSAITKSARAMRQILLNGLPGLHSTLRHISCVSKVSKIVYHNICQDASSFSHQNNVQVCSDISSGLPVQGLTSRQCVDL